MTLTEATQVFWEKFTPCHYPTDIVLDNTSLDYDFGGERVIAYSAKQLQSNSWTYIFFGELGCQCLT